MLSVANKHHERLRPLQFALINHRSCFMDRVVTVTYNNMTDGYGECVVSRFIVPPSDFKRSNYANLIWAKWRIIEDALAVATVAMWLDADVLILRNPWTALRTENGLHDVRYQSEPPPAVRQADTCTRPLPVCEQCTSFNGGQLVVRSAAFARDIYQSRPRNLSNTDRLDQDWANVLLYNDTDPFQLRPKLQVAPGTSYSSCVLPDSFAAQCWSNPTFTLSKAGRRSNSKALGHLCARVTHHFNCVSTRRMKGNEMKLLIEQWNRRCANSTRAE